MPEDPELSRLSHLLPFYVNGTLGAQECAQVDGALATSPALREELAVIGRLAQGVKTGGRALTQDIDGQVDRQAAQIEQAIASRPPARMQATQVAAPRGGMAGLLSFLSPNSWHPAVALTLAIAAVAQGLVIGNLSGEKAEGTSKIAALEKRLNEVEFQLASGPDGGNTSKANIMIQLKADTPWSAIEALLAQEELTITGGPSDGTLLLSSKAEGAALNTQITRLKASVLIEAADKAV
jgi:hypothetical protein